MCSTGDKVEAKMFYPRNMVLADRWKRISVDVTPIQSPFTESVEGSEVAKTQSLLWLSGGM